MCWGMSNHDAAMGLSQATGRGYENCLMDLMRPTAHPVVDRVGRLDVKAFRDVARESPLASDTSIANVLSRLTGSSFENVYTRMRMPDLDR